MRYNPFFHISEHPVKPWARFYRSSFGEKCLDTLLAFMGKYNQKFEVDSLGLLDYFSLGLFYWLHHFFSWCLKDYQDNFQAALLLIPSGILCISSWLVKFSISLVLTALSIPIIALVHQGSLWFGGASLKSNTLTIEGEDWSSFDRMTSKLSLHSFLSHHHRGLSDMDVTLRITEPSIGKHVYRQVGDMGSKLATMLYLKSKTDPSEAPKPEVRFSFFYNHPEQKPWLSNLNFVYSSVFLVSIFPWLAAASAKSIVVSASDRASKALWGGPRDQFDWIVDMENALDRQQLSALFQLNTASILEELYPTEEAASIDSEVVNQVKGDLKSLV